MGKITGFLKKNKTLLIVAFAIWIGIIIFFIAPISYSIAEATVNGAFSMESFAENIIPNIAKMNTFVHLGEQKGAGSIFWKNVLYSSILFVIFLAIGFYKGRKKSEYDKIEHGSSDWSQNGEQYTVLSKNKGLILAEDNYLPIDKIGNTNVLIVGGSGSGKSSSYSIPNAHQLLGSYIFTDPKGELYDKTAGYFKKNGYEVKLLNLVNPESSDSYNPLFHINSEIDVDIIASTIVKGQKREGSNADPYWDNMAELLLKALIYYLIAVRPKEEQNLASCAELVRAANNEGGSSLLADLMNQLPYDHPARMNYKSVSIAEGKTFSSILSTLQASLGKFDSKDIADVTSTNTINFEDIATRKTALFVVSSDTHTAYDFLLTIFFSQMIQQLYDFADKNGGKLAVPTFFILDEFANIGQIPDFDKKISTSRSRGISFSVILQNLDQLKNIYEKSYETIIGNCDTHVFLGSNSYATVEYFSKELGEKTITHESKSVNRNSKEVKQGYSESDQIMARALMTPDELRRMDNNECIIFEKGLKPIKAKKFWWFKKSYMVNDFNSTAISHNDYVLENRGNWRKFNPNNPYEEGRVEESKDLQISSLDDLFADIDDTQNGAGNANKMTENNAASNKNVAEARSEVENKLNDAPANKMQNQAQSDNQNQMQQNQNYMQNANQYQVQNLSNNNNNNVNKQTRNPDNVYGNAVNNIVNEQKNDDIDIEKELEAKFDELFGPENGEE